MVIALRKVLEIVNVEIVETRSFDGTNSTIVPDCVLPRLLNILIIRS